VRSELISLTLQKPDSLGYPFKLWTLERLQTAFEERQGVHLSDSTIWEWVEAEGFSWKRQQSWFHEDEKMGGGVSCGCMALSSQPLGRPRF
jgi:transposase